MNKITWIKSLIFLLVLWTMAVGTGHVLAQEPILTQQSDGDSTPTVGVQQTTDTPTPIVIQTTDTPTPEPPTVMPTSTPTATPAPPTAMPTSTPTATLMPPTATPTRTVTPVWPTDTPTTTPTWTSTTTAPQNCLDSDEPTNDFPGSGKVLVINQAISDMTLSPLGDVDFFLLWAKPDRDYQITTGSGNGLDTRLRVVDPGGSQIAANDDYKPGDPGSQVTFRATVENWYMIAVDSVTPIDWGCGRYSIKAVDILVPTSTPGPTSTPRPSPTSTGTMTPVPDERQVDDYEPNFDFNSAANIGVGQTVELNFNSYPAGTNAIDNDYFRLYVKIGDELVVETKDLAQGLDTNMVLYRDTGEVVTGNDDCHEGERRSCVEWQPDYTGVAYVLVGPVGTVPEAVSGTARAYKLAVTDKRTGGSSPTGMAWRPGMSGTPGATPSIYGQALPWKVTPLPPIPSTVQTSTIPFPMQQLQGGTPAPAPGEVQVRPLVMTPVSTAAALEAINVQVVIYYDENNNRAPDMSEGVAGVSVRVLDGEANRLLTQTFTDNQGYATLAVSVPGEVRLSVAYVGYNKTIKAPGGRFEIRIPALRLPSLIP